MSLRIAAFTMFGPPIATLNRRSVSLGIIPRAIDQLFELIAADEHADFLVKCSYMEIYIEQVFDLLSGDREPVRVREDPVKGVVCAGLTEVCATSPGAPPTVLRHRSAAVPQSSAHRPLLRHLTLSAFHTRVWMDGWLTDDVLDILMLGGEHRATAATSMNLTSSRYAVSAQMYSSALLCAVIQWRN